MNLLKKAEVKLSSSLGFDASYTARGSFWLLSGHFMTLFAILCTSYAFANFVDPQLYGNYRYLVSAAIIISLFSLSGLRSAVTQATARGLEQYFYTALKLSLQYGVITFFVALFAGTYYWLNNNQLLSFGFLLIGLLQPAINTTGLISPFLIGAQAFRKNTTFHLIKTIITTGFLVTSIFLTESVLIIFGTFLLSNLAAELLTLYFNKPKKEASLNGEETEEVTKYAKHTSVQNIFIGISNQLDKILVFQFLGAIELAVYAFATALPDQYKALTKTIDQLLLPRFSKYSDKTIKSNIFKKSLLYFVFLLLMAILYVLIAPTLFAWLYPVYGDSVWLSQIYAIGIIFGFGNIPFTAMKANLDNKKLYAYKLTIAIFQTAVLLLLLPTFGLIGAIWSRVIHRIFVCVFGYFLYFKQSTSI